MTPEVTILCVNAIFLAFAYLWAYPSIKEKTPGAILWRDIAISFASLIVAGLLYSGTQTPFKLVFFTTNWAIFSILTMAVMETPLFIWFAKRHNIKF